jgi:hypothetical protein
MRHRALTLIAACLAMTLLAADTLAKPKVRTQTQHYRVDGADAGAIVRSMMGQHRLLGGHGRVGRTKMTRKVDWEFSSTPGTCRVKRHTVRLDFVTQLPRHAAERRLDARLRKHWRGFAQAGEVARGAAPQDLAAMRARGRAQGEPGTRQHLRGADPQAGSHLHRLQRRVRQAPRRLRPGRDAQAVEAPADPRQQVGFLVGFAHASWLRQRLRGGGLTGRRAVALASTLRVSDWSTSLSEPHNSFPPWQGKQRGQRCASP